MKRNRKWIIGAVLGLVLAGLSVMPAVAMHQPTGVTVRAGFTDLPLRNCQGTYCGELMKLAHGQQLMIWWNDGEGWAYVEVAGTGKMGWVCLANTY